MLGVVSRARIPNGVHRKIFDHVDAGTITRKTE